jgi:hypothetical protein
MRSNGFKGSINHSLAACLPNHFIRDIEYEQIFIGWRSANGRTPLMSEFKVVVVTFMAENHAIKALVVHKLG